MAFWHRHQDYFSQNFSLLNEGWLADPIATFAAIAVVQGEDISETVQNGIKVGQGHDLMSYYQYATRRYKERNYKWKFQRIAEDSEFLTVIRESDLESLVPSTVNIPKRIVHENSYYYEGGVKFLWDMQQRYGLDSFHTNYNGKSVLIESLVNAKTIIRGLEHSNKDSWLVGFDNNTGKTPVFILGSDVNESNLSYTTSTHTILDKTDYKPEPSIGVVYWTSSTGEEFENNPEYFADYDQEYDENDPALADLLKNGDTLNTYIPTKILTDWKGSRYRYNSGKDDTDTADEAGSSNINVDTINDLNIENRETSFIYIHSLDKDPSTNKVHIVYTLSRWKSKIVYDQEHFLWATKNNTNANGLRQLFKSNKNITHKEILFNSKNSHKFKFYPYTPIRENYKWFLDVEDEDFKEIVDSYRIINEAAENSDKFNKEINSIRDRNKVIKKERKEETPEVKKAKRAVRRSTSKLRSTDFSTDIRTNKSKGRLERDLTIMSDDIRVSYKNFVANLYSTKGIENAYDIWLQPAVLLATDQNDVMIYWEQFWKRIYNIIGDGGYEQFKAHVEALKNSSTGVIKSSDIPLYRLDFSSEPVPDDNFFHDKAGFNGSISFAYIKKFKIKGTVRDIPRKRDLRDIRRGKHIKLIKEEPSHPNSHAHVMEELNKALGIIEKENQEPVDIDISKIDDLLNPPEELADDKYHKMSSGKDINIGGDTTFPYQLDIGEISSTTFSYWGYTFFCNPISDTEIEVIAVAGLCARTTVNNEESYKWAPAWYELGMFYRRNKQKYVEEANIEEQDVSYSHKTGSKKHRKINRIQYFFAIPLDYNTCRRMGGTRLTRFADRAVIIMSWVHQHVKTVAGWFGLLLRIIMVVITVVLSYFFGPAGAKAGASFGSWLGTALGNLTARALITKLATSILINMAVKYGLKLLAKVFGLKGLIIAVIAAIGLVLGNMTGMGINLNSLPYASQVAQAVVSQGSAVYQEILQQKMLEIQEKMKEEAKKYSIAMSELEDKQEEFYSRGTQYNVHDVLAAITKRVEYPEEFYARTLEHNPNLWCGEDYLSSFIEQKLSLDVQYFNLENSTDFSLKTTFDKLV